MTAKTDDLAVASRSVGGFRRGVAVAYGYLSGLFVLGVLVQVFLAGVGVFGMNASKVANASSFNAHRAWGGLLMLVAVLLLVLALVAWESLGTVIGTAVLVVLVVVAQIALASAGDSNKWFGGLHALDGMVILLLSVWLAVAARRRRALRNSS